jgi:formamidopyrimidine-DNA glycosylase
MPELPDLEVIKDFLAERIPGLTIESAEVRQPLIVRVLDGGDFMGRLKSQSIREITRRGKNLVFSLATGDYLVVTPMLAGRLRFSPHPLRRSSKAPVTLHLSNGMDLEYTDPKKMGKIYLTADLARIPRFMEQGPEALDPALTLEAFRARLRGRYGEIKGVLCSPEVVAGIGNAYVDEILFRAGVSPFRKLTRLDETEIARIYQAMRDVLSEAIAILCDRIGEDIHVEIRDFLAVHGKGGQPCPHCGTIISQITARQQTTSYCRSCQPGTLIQQ